jgi:hypothetical protein
MKFLKIIQLLSKLKMSTHKLTIKLKMSTHKLTIKLKMSTHKLTIKLEVPEPKKNFLLLAPFLDRGVSSVLVQLLIQEKGSWNFLSDFRFGRFLTKKKGFYFTAESCYALKTLVYLFLETIFSFFHI